ncbi:MAG: ABC transporter permease subunit [Dehalococcoidia bacterium]
MVALAFALVIALPAGLLIGHTNRAALATVSVMNVGRALPSLAFLAFALPLAFALSLGLGFWPTVLALVPLAIPLIVINTYTAIRSVDPDYVEAARGMGMREAGILFPVEIPVALPIFLAASAMRPLQSSPLPPSAHSSREAGWSPHRGWARAGQPVCLQGDLVALLLNRHRAFSFGGRAVGRFARSASRTASWPNAPAGHANSLPADAHHL